MLLSHRSSVVPRQSSHRHILGRFVAFGEVDRRQRCVLGEEGQGRGQDTPLLGSIAGTAQGRATG